MSNTKKIMIILLIFILSSLIYCYVIYPKSYPLQKAIDNKDTIYGPDGMYRVEALYHFVDTYKEGTSPGIRVVSYTKEGYPYIIDLAYIDKQLVAKIDNTRNLFGRSFFAETKTFDEITIDEDNNFFLISESGDSVWLFSDPGK